MTPQSTALAVRRAESTAVARPAAPQVDFAALWQMAEALVPTGFLPDHIRNPGQACAIILAGQELGMQPMRALRSLQMVKGKVTESADSQLARFKNDGGRAVFTTLTDTEAVLHLRHPNGDEHTETFTLEDARKAGLVGNGSMYQKYPKAMLRSRAITAGLKSLGWEGGVGVYDPAEAAEFSVSTPAVEGRTSAAPRTSQAAAGGTGTVTSATVAGRYTLPTLDDALEVTLPGAPEKWGGNGGKRLADIDTKMLRRAYEFFAKKADEGDERAMGYADALDVVINSRASEAALTGQAADADLPPKGPGALATTGTDGIDDGTLPFDQPAVTPKKRNALAEP